MTETQPNRLLAASLHEVLAAELPQRLDFYEHWLRSEGLRDGSIGMAPISAVVGFLRAEGEPYARVVQRAGTLAADWVVDSLPRGRRRLIGVLPRWLRARAALKIVATTTRSVNRGSRCARQVRGPSASLRLTGSVFCAARAPQTTPLCGFYLALALRTLERFDVSAVGRVDTCQAVGGDACVLVLSLHGSGTAVSTALAA